MPLGRTNKATLGVKLLSATLLGGLAGDHELWLSMYFNEHTMAAFLFKCMEDVHVDCISSCQILRGRNSGTVA